MHLQVSEVSSRVQEMIQEMENMHAAVRVIPYSNIRHDRSVVHAHSCSAHDIVHDRTTQIETLRRERAELQDQAHDSAIRSAECEREYAESFKRISAEAAAVQAESVGLRVCASRVLVEHSVNRNVHTYMRCTHQCMLAYRAS
jgi:hypothetical protein